MQFVGTPRDPSATALLRERLAFATTLGVLMQCRGLMEIVVVTVLYQENLIGSATFSALILFALISTALTIPGVRLVQRLLGEDATRAEIRA